MRSINDIPDSALDCEAVLVIYKTERHSTYTGKTSHDEYIKIAYVFKAKPKMFFTPCPGGRACNCDDSWHDITKYIAKWDYLPRNPYKKSGKYVHEL